MIYFDGKCMHPSQATKQTDYGTTGVSSGNFDALTYPTTNVDYSSISNARHTVIMFRKNSAATVYNADLKINIKNSSGNNLATSYWKERGSLGTTDGNFTVEVMVVESNRSTHELDLAVEFDGAVNQNSAGHGCRGAGSAINTSGGANQISLNSSHHAFQGENAAIILVRIKTTANFTGYIESVSIDGWS